MKGRRSGVDSTIAYSVAEVVKTFGISRLKRPRTLQYRNHIS